MNILHEYQADKTGTLIVLGFVFVFAMWFIGIPLIYEIHESHRPRFTQCVDYQNQHVADGKDCSVFLPD